MHILVFIVNYLRQSTTVYVPQVPSPWQEGSNDVPIVVDVRLTSVDSWVHSKTPPNNPYKPALSGEVLSRDTNIQTKSIAFAYRWQDYTP